MVKLFRCIRFDHIYHHPSQLIGHQFPYRTHRSLPIFACLSFFYFLASSSRLAAAQILPCNYLVLRGVVLFGPLLLGCGWVERLRCSATSVVIFAAWLRLAAPVPGRAGGPNWKGQQCLRCIESVCPHVLCGRWFSVTCVCKNFLEGNESWFSDGNLMGITCWITLCYLLLMQNFWRVDAVKIVYFKINCQFILGN